MEIGMPNYTYVIYGINALKFDFLLSEWLQKDRSVSQIIY